MLGRFPLGTMQGRLLPKYKGRYQAHPNGYWRDEFAVAAEAGLDLIEFILDLEDAAENPLFADSQAIKAITAKTGIGVVSICADYFMDAPLHTDRNSVQVLDRLIDVNSGVSRDAPKLRANDS